MRDREEEVVQQRQGRVKDAPYQKVKGKRSYSRAGAFEKNDTKKVKAPRDSVKEKKGRRRQKREARVKEGRKKIKAISDC